jgi:hypothetical protein
MASDWISVRELRGDEPQRADRSHSFISPKKMPAVRYCRYCGHVALKNWISTLVTRLGCGYEADPRYQTWLRTKRSPDSI